MRVTTDDPERGQDWASACEAACIWPFAREDDEVPKPSSVDREALPIPDRAYGGPVYEDAKDPAAKFAPIEPLRPPAGAPNVLGGLLGDARVGFARAVGGPCPTPTADRLAPHGPEFPPVSTPAL